MRSVLCRPDLLPPQPVIPAVLEDVLCCLFCFSAGAHGGWHEVESIMHVLVQLVVPGSQSDDELYLGERLKGVVYVVACNSAKQKQYHQHK